MATEIRGIAVINIIWLSENPEYCFKEISINIYINIIYYCNLFSFLNTNLFKVFCFKFRIVIFKRGSCLIADKCRYIKCSPD